MTLALVLFRKYPCLQFSYISAWYRGAADVSCLHPDRLWTAEQLHACNAKQEAPSQHMTAAKNVCTGQAHWQKRELFCMLTGCSKQLHLQCKRKQHQKVHIEAVHIFDVASSCMAPVVSLEAGHHAEQCMSLSHRWRIECRKLQHCWWCRKLQHCWCCTVIPVVMLAIDSTSWLKATCWLQFLTGVLVYLRSVKSLSGCQGETGQQ